MTLKFSTSSPFRPMAPVLEFVRCITMIVMHRLGYMTPLLPALAVPTEVRSPAVCFLTYCQKGDSFLSF